MSDAAVEKWSDEQVALVDLIDRVIGGGVVITGDLVLGVAGVDLSTWAFGSCSRRPTRLSSPSLSGGV